MATYELAHINHQGQDVMLIVVSPSVGSMGSRQQAELLQSLQASATSAGLRGGAALVWDAGGRIGSYGPTQWRGFLQSLTPDFVAQNVNRTLTCS